MKGKWRSGEGSRAPGIPWDSLMGHSLPSSLLLEALGQGLPLALPPKNSGLQGEGPDLQFYGESRAVGQSSPKDSVERAQSRRWGRTPTPVIPSVTCG